MGSLRDIRADAPQDFAYRVDFALGSIRRRASSSSWVKWSSAMSQPGLKDAIANAQQQRRLRVGVLLENNLGQNQPIERLKLGQAVLHVEHEDHRILEAAHRPRGNQAPVEGLVKDGRCAAHQHGRVQIPAQHLLRVLAVKGQRLKRWRDSADEPVERTQASHCEVPRPEPRTTPKLRPPPHEDRTIEMRHSLPTSCRACLRLQPDRQFAPRLPTAPLRGGYRKIPQTDFTSFAVNRLLVLNAVPKTAASFANFQFQAQLHIHSINEASPGRAILSLLCAGVNGSRRGDSGF